MCAERKYGKNPLQEEYVNEDIGKPTDVSPEALEALLTLDTHSIDLHEE